MKRLTLSLMLLLLSYAVPSAEPIVVRSGEHRNFTRLVMPLPNGSGWSLESETGVTTLLISDFDDGFDLRSAFEIIPRTRLRALVARGGELELQLTCDCRVNAFVERNAFIVLDIFDGPPLRQTIGGPVETAPLPNTRFSYGDLLWRSVESQPTGGDVDQRPGSEGQKTEIETNNPSNVDSREVVAETREELLKAFSKAASSGLITTKVADIERVLPHKSQDHIPQIYDSSEVPQSVATPPTAQIRITNSKDVPDINPIKGSDLEGAMCPSPDLVDVAAWGDGSDLGSQIAGSNEVLYDEVGRVSEPDALARARLFVYFGFGAEAIEALNLVSGLTSKNPELVDLANIMEHGYAKNPRSLHRFAHCSSGFALWGTLAAKDKSDNQEIDASAALLALKKLPAHLKRFLGKALASRLLAYGDIENASIAIRSFESLDDQNQKSSTMAHATVARIHSDDGLSEKIVADIVTKNTAEAPLALVAAIDHSIEQDTPLGADVALLAESYAFEYRNSDLGPEMIRSSVLAAAKSGQFTKALNSLEDKDLMSELTTQKYSELSSFVFSEIADRATDADFISAFFTHFESVREQILPSTIVEIASRLFDVGFTDNASALVEALPVKFESAPLRILRARALSSSGQFQESLIQIKGLEGSEARRLRAEILESMGSNREAAQEFADANMPERAASALWLSEDWPNLMTEDEPLFGELRQLSNEAALEIDVDQNMLARSAAAIASSEEARLSLEEVLRNLVTSE